VPPPDPALRPPRRPPSHEFRTDRPEHPLLGFDSHLRYSRRRGGWRGALALFGPAFVAAVAYVDPGNFATNIAGGAKYGYLLVWVVVMANVIAMFVQYLSAKLGIATGLSLPELCRQCFSRPVTLGLWVQAEIVAIATDLAEFLGAAIALNLLFGIHPFVAGVITAIVAFGILALQTRGYRRFEVVIAGLFAIVFLGFLYDLASVSPDGGEWARGFIPDFAGTGSFVLAAGILGATVMPHVVYLHSSLTANRIPGRDTEERRELLRFQRFDVFVALGLAGVLNMALLVVAAALFHTSGDTDVTTIKQAHTGLQELEGSGAGVAFAIALLASGLSSSSVGTFAGQVVMQGFIDRSIPLFVRRALTMAPSLVVLAIGVNPTIVLIFSQVVLSFGIPFALVPLVLLTRRRSTMAALVNRPWTTASAWIVAAMIICLNGVLLVRAIVG